MSLHPPHPIQFQGSSVAMRILRWLGWSVHFEGLPSAQGVIVVYPHTSNWDFPVGLLAKWAMGLQARFWAKHTLFAIPLFGSWLRWLGGVPVNRSASHGLVEQMVDLLQSKKAAHEYLWLAVTPEGTRSWRPGWRSGFYRVALGAQVPLALASLDFGRKQVRVVDFMTLTGDVEADMAHLSRVYEGSVGMRPEQAAPIRLEPAAAAQKENA